MCRFLKTKPYILVKLLASRCIRWVWQNSRGKYNKFLFRILLSQIQCKWMSKILFTIAISYNTSLLKVLLRNVVRIHTTFLFGNNLMRIKHEFKILSLLFLVIVNTPSLNIFSNILSFVNQWVMTDGELKVRPKINPNENEGNSNILISFNCQRNSSAPLKACSALQRLRQWQHQVYIWEQNWLKLMGMLCTMQCVIYIYVFILRLTICEILRNIC